MLNHKRTLKFKKSVPEIQTQNQLETFCYVFVKKKGVAPK